MNPIKSRTGIRRVINWLIYFFALCVGIWLCSIAFPMFSFNKFPPYALSFMGLAFCFIAVYGFIWDVRNIHSVVIDDEKIVVGRLGTFYWNDLEELDLYANEVGKEIYKAIMIKFKNEQPIYLYNYGYSNIDTIRNYIKEHVVNK